MSGFAGVWNIDGRPVERDRIARIGSAVAHRGGDYAGLWCTDAFGCAAHVRRVATESVHERQPLIDSQGNAFVFDGRLDNRDELLEPLRPTDDSCEIPDVDVALEAMHAWGDGALEKLSGDFAVAAFRADEKRLVLARDPVGCRPLYYWVDSRTVVFASEIKAVLAYPGVPTEPDEDLLADFCLRDQLPYEDHGETFFQGVRAVLPGYQVTVSARGIALRRFWDFNPESEIRYGTYGDYAARFRELLIQAVKRRLRGTRPVAIAVSGGLDSSAVLCIADDLLKHGAIRTPLVPMMWVAEPDRESDEQRASESLESTRQLRIDRIAIGPADPEMLTAAAWHSEWPRLDEAWRARQPVLIQAQSVGARTIVTGNWSDQLLFVTGYLTDLMKRLAWAQVLQHLREYPRWFVDADPGYFRSRFRRALLLNLAPHEFRARLRRLHRSRAPEWSRRLVSASLLERLNRDRLRLGRPRSATAHARDIYQFVRTKSHRLQFEADEKLSASCGVDSVTPFLDRDLIAYLMSIPGEIQNRNGIPRALLRDAMRGVVPDVILNRRWKNHDPAVARERQSAWVLPPVRLEAARRLGFLQDGAEVDSGSVDLLGLELWSRVFFSDRLAPSRPTPHGVTEPMDTSVTPRADDREKLPYSPPKLTVHGDLRTITAAKQSDRSEAGQPKTFSSGMP
jgi:asparagine synthase (glutamine-hydrolysing)